MILLEGFLSVYWTERLVLCIQDHILNGHFEYLAITLFVPFYFWLAVFANMKENRCMQISGKWFLGVQYSYANQQIQTDTKCRSSHIGKNQYQMKLNVNLK